MIIIIVNVLYLCLLNVPKQSFLIFSFHNKSIINHKSVSLDWQRCAVGISSGLFRASVKDGFEQNRCAGLDEREEAARRSSEM